MDIHLQSFAILNNSVLQFSQLHFSSVQSLSRVRLFATPLTAACQTTLSVTISLSLLRLTSVESMMPSNHLILSRPLLLSPSVFPSIRVFSKESVLHVSWPKYWSTPGFPVPHYLLELAQTHVHQVGDAIHPSHPLLSLSPLTFSLSQHQGFFQ